MNVTTRSYDSARTGANTGENILTPGKVSSNILVKALSLHFGDDPKLNDDPRLEAQPLYVSKLKMHNGTTHDVVFVCTMANNVWAFSAADGKVLWKTNLGRPIKPAPKPHLGFPEASDIDMWGVNRLWGILSTPCIDTATHTIYVVAWTSADGTTANAVHELHALDITSGAPLHAAIPIKANAQAQNSQATLTSPKQKQRSALLLTAPTFNGEVRKTLFIAFATTHEEGDTSHGWVVAVDVKRFQVTAAWCTSPNGAGVGVWQAGQGPAADENNAIYLMTGNYGVQDQNKNTVAPHPGDLPESLIKLGYTLNNDGTGKLVAEAWFTPFRDVDRGGPDDDFQDYDLGSAGPVPLPGTNLLVGAGKDGVVYVLPRDTASMGQGSDFGKLKKPPIFFTYFPGSGIDAADIRNLDKLFDGKTHHLHASPAFWVDPKRGPMLFCWGENECLRGWTIGNDGTISFVAKSAEVASAGMPGRGGMPGGFLVVTSNGNMPNTGIVWATAPVSGDANKHVVEGVLRAYDATNLDATPNADGTPKLRLLWQSKQIPGNTFNFSKFCPPVVADGRILVPTYDGRVDIYTLISPPHTPPLPTNANIGAGDD
jgi:hypothetical protein